MSKLKLKVKKGVINEMTRNTFAKKNIANFNVSKKLYQHFKTKGELLNGSNKVQT